MRKEDQLKVYAYYLGTSLSTGRAMISPLPVKVRGSHDSSPSFALFESYDKDILWKDFGSSSHTDLVGDAIKLILVIEGLSSRWEANDYFERLIKPARFSRKPTLKQVNLSKSDIVVSVGEYLDFELGYWKKFGIHRGQLESNRIYPSRGITWAVNSEPDRETVSTKQEPKYVYDLSEAGDMTSWKLYNPLAKNVHYKWRSKNTKAIPAEGYYFLPPKGDLLIITSSTKDRMVLNNFGLLAINPTSESAHSRLLSVKDELNLRFKKIFIIFDGDKPGIDSAKRLKSKTGWGAIKLAYPPTTKDPSEVVQKLGADTLTVLLHRGLKKYL